MNVLQGIMFERDILMQWKMLQEKKHKLLEESLFNLPNWVDTPDFHSQEFRDRCELLTQCSDSYSKLKGMKAEVDNIECMGNQSNYSIAITASPQILSRLKKELITIGKIHDVQIGNKLCDKLPPLEDGLQFWFIEEHQMINSVSPITYGSCKTVERQPVYPSSPVSYTSSGNSPEGNDMLDKCNLPRLYPSPPPNTRLVYGKDIILSPGMCRDKHIATSRLRSFDLSAFKSPNSFCGTTVCRDQSIDDILQCRPMDLSWSQAQSSNQRLPGQDIKEVSIGIIDTII